MRDPVETDGNLHLWGGLRQTRLLLHRAHILGQLKLLDVRILESANFSPRFGNSIRFRHRLLVMIILDYLNRVRSILQYWQGGRSSGHAVNHSMSL